MRTEFVALNRTPCQGGLASLNSSIGDPIAMNAVLIRVCCYVIGLLAIGAALPPVAFAQSDEHRTGYQPDDPEVPGTVAHVSRFRAFLPPFKDLSASFPPPGDQGRQDSCVAWSLGYALRGYYYRQRMQSRTNDPGSLLSPAFIYNQVVKTPDCSGGSKLKDALDLMRTEGIPTLAEFPYDERSCVRKPNDDIKRRAAANTIAAYRSFGRPGEIRPDDVKGSLLAGTPIAIGMNIDAKAAHPSETR